MRSVQERKNAWNDLTSEADLSNQKTACQQYCCMFNLAELTFMVPHINERNTQNFH